MTGGKVFSSLSLLLGSAALTLLPRLHAEPEVAPFDNVNLEVLALRTPQTEFAVLPEATFLMGSSLDETQMARADCAQEPLRSRCQPELFEDERPTRTVRVSAFALMRHEVSVAEFERCVAARRCRPPPYFRGGQRFRQDDFPVSLVSWQDARDYCAFLGGRLPSEAEFERAARGTERRLYPWGNLYNEHVVNHGQLASDPTSDSDGYLELAPVGSFPSGATPEGVWNLAGNVAEWVSDRYAPEYEPRDTENPQGPLTSAASNQRVVRGGDYESLAAELRGAARVGAPPETRRPSLGFRCVRGTASN